MLEEMAKTDPKKILTSRPDMETLTAKAITVEMRLKEMKEAHAIDNQRVEILKGMMAKEKNA